MARKAILKTVIRKTKITLVFRGRKVFDANDWDSIESFKTGWYKSAADNQQSATT